MKLSMDVEKKLPGFGLKVKLDMENGILGLLGASGSGKSMTLRCIAGIETPSGGSIAVNDRILFDSKRHVNIPVQKRRIGFLFQNYALFPHMTVEDNIGFGLGKQPPGTRTRIVKEKIAMMQLGGLEKRYPNQLSGGQQQRVALARALAVEPEVLLLDEPFSALDEYLKDQMIDQMLETLEGYRGITLFVTHNIEEAYRICDNIAVLSDGRIKAYGKKEAIFSSPPSLAAAQITGCRNISKVSRISGDVFEAVDWGCRLNAANIPEDAAYVGIRSHDIALSDNGHQAQQIDCWPVSTAETPFRVTVYLSVGRAPSEANGYQLQWEAGREEWDRIKDMPLPWKVCLSPDKLFFIADGKNI